MISSENRKNVAAVGANGSGKTRGGASRGKASKGASLRERFSGYFAAHGFAAVVCIAVLVFAGLGLTFWFVVFSGLAQSADFIYSQF